MTQPRYFVNADYPPAQRDYWVCRAGEPCVPVLLVSLDDFDDDARDVARSIAALLNCREEATRTRKEGSK